MCEGTGRNEIKKKWKMPFHRNRRLRERKRKKKRIKNVLLLLRHHSRRCRRLRRGSRRFRQITHTRQMRRHIDSLTMRRTCMYFEMRFRQWYLLNNNNFPHRYFSATLKQLQWSFSIDSRLWFSFISNNRNLISVKRSLLSVMPNALYTFLNYFLLTQKWFWSRHCIH